MRKLLFLAFFLLLVPLVGAITVEKGVTFQDTHYSYESNTIVSPTTLNVTAEEFFLNGVKFCRNEFIKSFITKRQCSRENICEDTFSMWATFIGIIALLSGIGILIIFIAMFSGAEVNPAALIIFFIVFIVSMALMSIASEVLTATC